MLPVVILAGGMATRLRPLTEKIPKSMIQVARRPFIEHQLLFLKEQGVSRVVICIGYLGEMIKGFVGSGSRYGLNITYVEDGDFPLGTGGAIMKALPVLKEEFFILYGDSFLPISFHRVHEAYVKSKTLGLMTIYRNKGQLDKSNVQILDGGLIDYDKNIENVSMDYIDYGLSVINPSAFAEFKNDVVFDLAVVFQSLSKLNQLRGYEVFERFYEIGSISGLSDAEKFFLSKKFNDIYKKAP